MEKKQKKMFRQVDHLNESFLYRLYSGYILHMYSGHSDIVATFPGTKFMYSIILWSYILARKEWPKVVTISEMHCVVLYFNNNKISHTFLVCL